MNKSVMLSLLAILGASPALAQGFSCEEWSVTGYQEGGALLAIITDDKLIWTNGTITSEATFIHRGLSETMRVYAEGNTLYLVSGISAVQIRRVHMASAESDSVTLCKRSD